MTNKNPVEDPAMPQAPAGYRLASGRGPFTSHNGPYYNLEEQEEGSAQAFYALPRHANGLGLVHGGMLSAFMDGLLAAAAYRATQKTGVTIHLSINFLHMARVGEWVMGEAKVTRSTRDIAFVEGRAYVGGHDVVRASGVFKLMNRRS